MASNMMSFHFVRVVQVGSRLRGLGASLFTNTATLLEQVQDAIAQEIESIDGHINRASRSSSRTASRYAVFADLGLCSCFGGVFMLVGFGIWFGREKLVEFLVF